VTINGKQNRFRSVVGSTLGDWRTEARHALLGHPRLGPAYLRINPLYSPRSLHRETQIVIDGFPRSANSYAMFAFLRTNPQRRGFAGHSHSPHLLRMAAERNLPAIVLLREPGAACASYAQYLDTSRLDMLLDAWSSFHSVLQPITSRLVVAPFEAVITDFGEVVQACNIRYGTEFSIYRPSKENERAVRHELDHSARSRGRLPRHRVARPDPTRRASREVLDRMDGRDHRSFARATEIYLELLADAHPH